MDESKRNKALKSRKFVRHKKKNWRKHCDVSEIEDWLEERRKQEASGVKPASERIDKELFHIDEHISDSVPNKLPKTFHSLKSEQYALPDLTVAPIASVPHKKRYHKSPVAMETNDEDGIADSSEDEEYPRKMLYPIRTRIMATGIRGRKYSKTKQVIKSERLRDIWSSDNTTSTKTSTVKRSARLSKPLQCNLCCIPHPGTSYNPDYIGHQRLIKKALRLEMEKKSAQDKLNKALNVSKMTFGEREHTWRQEMLEGLVPDKETEREEHVNENEVAIVKRPIKASNKKTLKQRRKERLARRALQSKKQKHTEKIQMDEVYRIRSLKRELRKANEAAKAKMERKHAARVNRDMKRVKRLGKHPYQSIPIDVKLSDEMVGSLRLLQAEGNNSRTQYDNILRRNMAAPKGPRNPKRLHKHKPHVKWIESRAYNLRPDQLEIH